jgi:hypothetical protein
MNLEAMLLDHTLWNLLIRFFINLFVLYILTGVIYYRFSKKEEYVFSFMLMGIMIFLICSILESIEVKMGTAMGLFAVFAILRFRTVTYTVKDITYVFLIIGVSVINSQAHIPPPIVGALLINSSIILITYIQELYWQKKYLEKIIIIYNKPELLKPGLKKDLLKDLSRQTGQNVEKVIVLKIDINRENAEIEVYYKEKITL